METECRLVLSNSLEHIVLEANGWTVIEDRDDFVLLQPPSKETA